MTKVLTLVERLRAPVTRRLNYIERTFPDGYKDIIDPLKHEAADEIERLEARDAAETKRSIERNTAYEHDIKELESDIQNLQRALSFWMPLVPLRPGPDHDRLAADAYLLAGYDGPNEDCAQILGWIVLKPQSASEPGS